MSFTKSSPSSTWLEINSNAVLANIAELRKGLPSNTKFTAIIKANAYGHGLLEIATIISNHCDYLAVFDFLDALKLRKNEVITPIFVLSELVDQKHFAAAAAHKIELTIASLHGLRSLAYFLKNNPDKQLVAHLCIDSGMGRDGFLLQDLAPVVNFLKHEKRLHVKGLYAHFSSADDSSYDTYSQKQRNELVLWHNAIKEIGITPILHHSASAATIRHRELNAVFDMVRVGVAMYGLWPSAEIKQNYQNQIQLKPVMTWKVRISDIKTLAKNSAISYGCSHILQRDSKLAILPIGYYDGIPRLSSNKGWFLVKGKKVPQLGRVTMNMVVLDVTDVDAVEVGDIATVIGCDGDVVITADHWAEWSNTINYEITTRINPNLLRVVL